MKIFNVINILSLFFSAITYADVCSEVKCPKGKTPTKICFSDPEVSSALFNADNLANCGYFTDVVIT